jgi:hypothetical protein
MGIFDEMKDKAEDAVEGAKGMASAAVDKLQDVGEVVIDKGGDAIDAVTGGRFAEKIDAAQAKATDLIGAGDDEAPAQA